MLRLAADRDSRGRPMPSKQLRQRPSSADRSRSRRSRPGWCTRATPGACCSSSGAGRGARGAGQIEAAVTRAGHALEGLIVQPMAAAGVELIVGVVNDPSFGPVLACGAGGTTAELIKDVAVRITPVTDVDARGDAAVVADLPATRRLPGGPARTWRRSRMCCSGWAQWSRLIPRSSSSTATR